MSAQTSCGALSAKELASTPPPVVVVPISRWNRIAKRALRFAIRISPDVRAVQVLGADVETENLGPRWDELVERPLRAAALPVPPLDTVPSGYRRLFTPLLAYIARIGDQYPDRDVAVVVPELIERRWYHALLRTHRASVLKTLLLLRGGPKVIIINTPWHLAD